MANTMTLIQSVTVPSGGASSIDFTSIPSTYTDLVIKLSLRSNRGTTGEWLNISYNGSTTSFTAKYIEGNGAAASSGNDTRYIADIEAANNTASVFSSTDVYIPNYAGSANKSLSADSVAEQNGTTAYSTLVANLWSNTAAINQVTLTPGGGTAFLQYSTAYLYGVKSS